jgi:hypothetical protein
MGEERGEEEKLYYYYRYYKEEEGSRKMQTKMGFWEWPDWSIVLVSVFLSVLAAIYVFVVCVLMVVFMRMLRARRRLYAKTTTIWRGLV